ncbi:ATP/GTP-binding protein [Streptomyces virginiae]|uniref:ATP/GTP-binding protein n=1 Tax=Streptomyces virginiae TaxID=1961 RepID=UPI00363C2D5A
MGRTTLGQAIGEEAQRRWGKRRADAKAAQDAKEAKKDKSEDDKAKGTDAKDTGTDADDKAKKDPKDGPDGAPSDGKATPAGDESGKDSKAADEPRDGSKGRWFRRRSGGSDRSERRGRTRRTGTGRAGRTGREGRSSEGRFGPPPRWTTEWPDHPSRPPGPAEADTGDDIVDAVIVPDEPAAVTTGVRGLPPAPEPHAERPGTTRETHKEDSVSSSPARTGSAQSNMAAKHRTDITFDEFLVSVANIALAATSDKELADKLAAALGKLAKQLDDMAGELADDHNIDAEVTDLLSDLCEGTAQMKREVERCAQECHGAWEVAVIAGRSVAKVYGQDMDAKRDAGLAQVSSAAHHQ